jgi:hypothetical protein
MTQVNIARCEAIRQFRNKNEEYLKATIDKFLEELPAEK